MRSFTVLPGRDEKPEDSAPPQIVLPLPEPPLRQNRAPTGLLCRIEELEARRLLGAQIPLHAVFDALFAGH